jgi:hypothetical protein
VNMNNVIEVSPPAAALKMKDFYEWAMLGSNQRPLPCEGRSITLWLFATVQKYLQNSAFSLSRSRVCSPLFVWVGVLLVYISLGV